LGCSLENSNSRLVASTQAVAGRLPSGGVHGERSQRGTDAEPMPDVRIENPVINSPFEAPRRQFLTTDDGSIIDQIAPGRRRSQYLLPVPGAKSKGKQLTLHPDMAEYQRAPNQLVNDIRAELEVWRKGTSERPAYHGVTKTTRQLLDYWTNPQRERRLFFCQIEALETIIFLTEAIGNTTRQSRVKQQLRAASQEYSAGLERLALKMATGSGKTVVMAMLIAWHTLNKLRSPKDQRFCDTFLVITPGITIRDRLRVLLPSDEGNYYRQHDIVPIDLLPELSRANIHITNYHAFIRREQIEAAKLTKDILREGDEDAFRETPDEMVSRVCRGIGGKGIIVINDEAHHCYRPRQQNAGEKLSREERQEARKREEQARVWMSGVEAVRDKLGVKAVYDLSATPFFLSGSGYREGTLFPWVVMDFSLIDAIECGIVKTPRVPVADNTLQPGGPMYRYFWQEIRQELPRPSDLRRQRGQFTEPVLPKELEGALQSLYHHYERSFGRWQESVAGSGRGSSSPPVFIVVCNNTAVSKLVCDYISGHEKPRPGEDSLDPDGDNVIVPGQLALLSNAQDGNWLRRPVTLLIDSEQLESGEALSPEFKKIAAVEIAEFKAEYRRRYPDRDVSQIDDAHILREVMNTVGKSGKLGEQVRCVVSVSMLTEGWDANTVTHILGVRAFGTQLLCEQVVGRGLRRRSYARKQCSVRVNGKEETFEGFPPEYADIYGVPFRFIPAGETETDPPEPVETYHVYAMAERAESRITFPRVVGYRYELPEERLTARFSEDSRVVLSTESIATWTENAPLVGESVVHTLDDLRARRIQEVEFLLAKLLLERYFQDDDGHSKPWLFPQLLRLTREWLGDWVECKDDCFPQLLLLLELAHDAADRMHMAIVRSHEGQATLKPRLHAYSPEGSTDIVDFETARPVFETAPGKCHVNLVVADTETWEQAMACKLERMDEVVRYVKNEQMGFTIPYTVDGQEHQYVPDFIACIEDGHGAEDLLNLVIEVSGFPGGHKDTKVATAKTLWVPAANNHGGFGRWGFVEVTDVTEAAAEIRTLVSSP